MGGLRIASAEIVESQRWQEGEKEGIGEAQDDVIGIASAERQGCGSASEGEKKTVIRLDRHLQRKKPKMRLLLQKEKKLKKVADKEKKSASKRGGLLHQVLVLVVH